MAERAQPDEEAIAIAALEAAADRIEAEGKEVVPGAWLGSSDFDGKEGVARLGMDPSNLDIDVDDINLEWLTDQLNEKVLGAETLLEVSKEPRGGMLTYNLRIVALPLPSDRRLYIQLSDYGDELLGLARGPSADERFLGAHGGEGVDIPVDVNVEELYAIDYIWTLAAPGSYVHEALTDGDADWMSTRLMDKGGERRSELTTALEEALDAREITHEDFEREEERLNTVTSWFLTVSGEDLDAIAALPMPAPDCDPPLGHAFTPWQRPTAEIFADPTNPVNLQHIVASFRRADHY
jgi:hypothetical protein